MTASQRTGILLLVLSAAGYAFMPILTKWAFERGIQPLELLTWRFIIAAPAVWVIVLFAAWRATPQQTTQKTERLPVVSLLLLGGLFALASLTAFYALQRLPASTYTVLLYTYPAVVALLLLLMGDALSRRGWLALALTLVGVALTVPNVASALSGGDTVGLLMALGNGSQYALYIVLSSRVLRGRTALLTASALSITGSLLLMLVLALINGLRVPTIGDVWLIYLLLALVCTVLTNVCFYAGMQRIGAGQAAILSTLEPVLVLVLAFLILRETMLPIQLVGGALILASAVLLQLPEKRAESGYNQP